MNEDQVPTHQLYINGRWVESVSGRTYPVTNPAHSTQMLGTVQAAVVEDACAAVEAAHAALEEWTNTPAPQRGSVLYKAFELLRDRQDEFAKSITMEEGKTYADALGEVKRSMNIIEYSAGEGRRLFGYTTPSELTNTVAYTTRRPLGVVGIITPWNFPLAIPAWKIAPALVCGNTLIFKPASSTPLTAIKLVELFEEAGLPPGVLNIVTGSGASVGDSLVNHPKVNGISFTGSTEIGTRLYSQAAESLKKVQCEMGGKNAVIVLADADIDKTLGGVVQGAFGSTGQRCTATSRVIVEESIYEPFVEELIRQTSQLKIGDGMLDGIDVSPTASESQYTKILEYIGIGTEEGAKLAYGGHGLNGPEFQGGYYVEPTIFIDVQEDMRIAQEEIFGPVLTVFKANDLDDAIRLANSVKFGLSSSIYTQDLNKGFQYVNQVEAGMVHINAPTLGGEVHLPFGGTKASGVGAREQGTEAINFFSEVVTVYIDYSTSQTPAKFI